LYNSVKDIIPEKLNKDILIILDQLYIDSRYPGEMGLLPNGKPTLNEVNELLDFAKKVFDSAKSVCQNR